MCIVSMSECVMELNTMSEYEQKKWGCGILGNNQIKLPIEIRLMHYGQP
jgi:hypothetical protein